MWTRQQLLQIPPETLAHLPREAVEEIAPEPINDIATNDPRPTGMSWRYENKDAMAFPAAYFKSIDELYERDRTGTIVSRTRERARGANRGA